MRFQEFGVNEVYSTFLKGLVGSSPSALQSFGLELPDLEKTKTSDNTTGDAKNDKTVDEPSFVSTSNGLPVNGPISSGFGRRARGMHYGTDFAVPIGTPVVAPEDGVVWQAGWGGDAGIMVAINSGNTQHKLMHLSKVKVAPGDKVKRGQAVGLSGNTGYSTGPHLHWSKYVGGKPIDPMSNVG